MWLVTGYSSAVWLAATAAAVVLHTSLSGLTFSPSGSTIRNACVLYSLLALSPFVAYLVTGESWTGLSLDESDTARIVGSAQRPGHAFGMFAWFAVSMAQLLSYKRAQRWHNRAGMLAFGVLAFCLVEIAANAIFTFLPAKPELLAQAILQSDHVSTLDVAKFSSAFSVGLLLPVGVAAHGWFAYAAIAGAGPRNARLHIHHSASLICWILGPGAQRLIIRGLFAATECKPFGDPRDVMRVQIVSFHLAGFAVLTQLSLLVATLPPKLKDDSSVWLSRKILLGSVMLGTAASGLLGVEPWPTCA